MYHSVSFQAFYVFPLFPLVHLPGLGISATVGLDFPFLCVFAVLLSVVLSVYVDVSKCKSGSTVNCRKENKER